MKELVVYIMKATNPIKWEEWGRIKADGKIVGPADFSQMVEGKVKRWDIDLIKESDREKLQVLMGGVRMKTRLE